MGTSQPRFGPTPATIVAIIPNTVTLGTYDGALKTASPRAGVGFSTDPELFASKREPSIRPQ